MCLPALCCCGCHSFYRNKQKCLNGFMDLFGSQLHQLPGSIMVAVVFVLDGPPLDICICPVCPVRPLIIHHIRLLYFHSGGRESSLTATLCYYFTTHSF